MTNDEVPSRSYDPKGDLYRVCPDMKAFGKTSDKCLEAIAELLAEREWAGADTSFARAALLEVRWRTNATADVAAARRAFDRLRAAVDDPEAPGALVQDDSGSFAPGADPWFLKLDRSTDQLLARQWPYKLPPVFLEAIDDPMSMVAYLQDLTWCDVARTRRDSRKELNLAISVVARLVMRGGQAGYVASPGCVSALERFVASWQQPKTGFFGVTYVTDPQGSETTTQDLSLTFHVVRYLPHLVRYWHELVETLLASGQRPYPEGWLNSGGGMSDHNNYDVAEIFHRAWRFMRPDQRSRASTIVTGMVAWCCGQSVSLDGEVLHPDTGDMVPDSYYFAAAFLDTVGIFDRAKCFWTDAEPLPFGWSADRIQVGMAKRLARFNPHLTVVGDALERLHVRKRSLSTAML